MNIKNQFFFANIKINESIILRIYMKYNTIVYFTRVMVMLHLWPSLSPNKVAKSGTNDLFYCYFGKRDMPLYINKHFKTCK